MTVNNNNNYCGCSVGFAGWVKLRHCEIWRGKVLNFFSKDENEEDRGNVCHRDNVSETR